MDNNLPNLNADELSAYASAKHLAGVPDAEIQENIVRMLRSDGWKDAAITPMINEIARRTKGVAETKGSPRSPPKAHQDATAAMITQMMEMLAPMTARLATLEQREHQTAQQVQPPESHSGPVTPPIYTESNRRTKYPHPELFNGDRTKYSAFRYKTKAKLYSDYDGTSNRTKIAYVVSRCSERASDVILPWAEQNQDFCSIEDLWHFLNQQYDDPHLKAKALDQLSNLRQGRRTIRDYHMEFNRLELQSGVQIDNTQKKSMFSKGLNVELQKALVLVSENLSFEQFAHEATRVSDSLYRVSLATRSQRELGSQQRQNGPNRVRTPSPPENMDWEPTKVNKAGVKDRRLNNNQVECYVCGEEGHMAKYCAKRAKSKNTRVSRAAEREPSPSCKCQASRQKSTVNSDPEDSGKE